MALLSRGTDAIRPYRPMSEATVHRLEGAWLGSLATLVALLLISLGA